MSWPKSNLESDPDPRFFKNHCIIIIIITRIIATVTVKYNKINNDYNKDDAYIYFVRHFNWAYEKAIRKLGVILKSNCPKLPRIVILKVCPLKLSDT